MAEYALFVPECFVDTALTLSLVQNRRQFISHQQGIGNVGRVMLQQSELNGTGRRVVGLVDRDKKFRQQPYLSTFTTIRAGGLGDNDPHCILQHPERPSHYLIVLNPACDTWLFRAAQAAGVHLPSLGLPETLPDFIQFCKQEDVEQTKPMQELLWAIQQARPAVYRELADFVSTIMDISSSRRF